MKNAPDFPHHDPHRALRIAADPSPKAELFDAFILAAAATAALAVAAFPGLLLA